MKFGFWENGCLQRNFTDNPLTIKQFEVPEVLNRKSKCYIYSQKTKRKHQEVLKKELEV